MLIACWSVKGGTGTTVTTAALAVLLARSVGSGALAVDASDGDLAAVLGLPDDHHVGGASEWLGSDADAAALARLERPVQTQLSLLGAGRRPGLAHGTLDEAREPYADTHTDRLRALTDLLITDERMVVADCGLADVPLAAALRSAAAASLLVLRPCFLALRKALQCAVRPTGVVLITEEGRALDAHDVEQLLGVPVCARIAQHPDIARCVDAGLLSHALPRPLARGLRHAA